jgi:hypothetical protein
MDEHRVANSVRVADHTDETSRSDLGSTDFRDGARRDCNRNVACQYPIELPWVYTVQTTLCTTWVLIPKSALLQP